MTMLTDSARLWLATGERCPAAETIFTYTAGQDALSDHGEGHPETLEDFRRCRLLLEQCPELQPFLSRVAHLSPTWAEFIAFWDDIAVLQDLEDETWREAAGKAPKARKMIEAIIERTTPTERKPTMERT